MARDAGGYQVKVEDGPWPAFPADLTSIALALATQAEGTVLIFEKMFENRLVFTDKLVAMGAQHHPLRSAPRGDLGADAAAWRAPGVARHPRRDGDADRRPVRRGRVRDRQHRARSTAATSASTSACARWARGSSAWSRSVCRVIHPTPSGTRDVLPDEMRELRGDQRRVPGRLRGARLRRGRHAGARVRGRARSAATRRRPTRVQALRRAGQRARAALGHDDPDRARRGRALPDAPSRRCASATSPTPTAPCARSAGRRASCCRRASSWWARAAPGGTVEALEVLCAALDAAGLDSYRIGLGDASLYPALLDRLGIAPAARERLLHELRTRDFVGPRARGGGARPRRRGRRAARARAADARRAGGARRARGTGGRRARRAAQRLRAPAGGRRRADHLRPRAVAVARLLHGRRSSRSTTRRSARRSAAAGATTTCSGASGATCPPWAWRWASSGCTSRSSARGAPGSGHGPERAHPRGPARRAPGRDARPARPARGRHARGARERPQAAVRGRRARHDAALATCRRTSRRAPPTSGSPARTCSPSRPSATSTSCSTSATGRAGWCSPPSRGPIRPRRRCGGWG